MEIWLEVLMLNYIKKSEDRHWLKGLTLSFTIPHVISQSCVKNGTQRDLTLDRKFLLYLLYITDNIH